MSQFLTNTTTNSVVHSPGTWTTRILGTTQDLASSTGYTSVPELKVAIGKYERMLLKWRIHWAQNTTGRFKCAISTPGSVTGVHTAFTGINPANSAILLKAVTTDPSLDVDVAGTAGYLEIEMNIENAATAGAVDFQYAQMVSNPNPAQVLRGSYVEYRRF